MQKARQWKVYLPGVALLVLSLVVALFVYKDYGVSWDEPEQRFMGEVSYNYIFHNDNTLDTFPDRNHGVSWELVLTVLEKKLGITDSAEIYYTRHLVSHILFLLCVFCGYVLVQRLFKNVFISCLGFVMLAFHPRLYAHSFFNSKDLPFLGIFLVALLLSNVAFEKNRAGWYALLGIACGYATGIRILGILPVVILSAFLIADLIHAAMQKNNPVKAVANFVMFVGSFCLSLYACWPVLWKAPVQSFVSNFTSLSHFPWNGQVLFNGTSYAATALPWFYLPGWFAITTPLLWLVAGAAGIGLIIISFARKPMNFIKNTPDRNFTLYVLCFFLPVLAIIALHSVVYDDWRHVYFIYPPFVMLALYAIAKLWNTKWRIAVAGLCICQAAATSIFMFQYHPFQQAYFNQLVSHGPEQLRASYDLDTWGTSCKQALEHILAHDNAPVLRVAWAAPVKNNVKLLSPVEQKRIFMVGEDDKPDYYITNFRMHPGDYNYPNVFYEIRVLNSTILRVYKLK